MTNEEAIKMLKAKRYCMELETSGTEEDCNEQNCDNCPYNYEQGNMGEQKQAIDLAIKALEKINHLTDRPCEACEFRKDNGCCKWGCVFEEDKE